MRALPRRQPRHSAAATATGRCERVSGRWRGVTAQAICRWRLSDPGTARTFDRVPRRLLAAASLGLTVAAVPAPALAARNTWMSALDRAAAPVVWHVSAVVTDVRIANIDCAFLPSE